MATTTYLRLFPAVNQFELKNGALNVGGRLFVYYDGTDDLAEIRDEDGTLLQQPSILDNDGRALGLFVDAKKVYRLVVQDADGAMQYTVTKMVPSGGGAGSALGNQYDVVSTDGSITVDQYVDGGVTKFDIGLGPHDSDEFLEWCKCAEKGIANGAWLPVFMDGSMETDVTGLKVGKDKFYHFTFTFKVDPTGTGVNYETLSTILKFTDYTDIDLVRRNFDIDNSTNDPVLCEFSYDFKAPADGHIFMYIEGVSVFEQVDVELQCHRIYSGINAVPDTCATKQWVQETFDYNMAEKIGYSALGYNLDGEITGISGSSIAGGLNSATVSSIASSVASSYAESAASSKQDISGMSAWIPWSSSSVFQPSGDYAQNSALSSYVAWSASGAFAPSGDYAFNSSLSSKVDQSAFDDCCTAMHSALDGKLDKSASGQFAPSGDYAYNSSLSAYYPASASGAFQPSGNYQTAGDYAFNSAVSSKLDSSASSNFVLNSSFSSWSSDVDSSLSSFSSSITSINSSITDIENSISSMSSDMSAYVPFSGLEGDGMKITGISGSAIKGHEYTGINPVLVDNVNDTISVDHRTLCVDSTLTAYNSGSSAVLGVNVSALDISSKLDASASSMFQLSGDYAYNSSLSSKMDASASSDFYSTSNPSGFITGVDLSEYAFQSAVDLKADASALSSYQPTSAMSAYATESWASAEISAKLDVTASSLFITALPADLATTADVASAVSGKMDQSASGEFYPMTGNPSGFLTAHQSLAGLATETYVDSAVSGKLDSTAYDSAQFQLTADMSAYQLSGDYYSASNPSGFITGVDLSPYQTTAGMSAYQTTADMSGYQPSGDYADNSALGLKQDASAMTAYQEVSGMTAYQPSGDYIHASSLGIAEV